MFKELKVLEEQKHRLVEQCNSQRYQVADEFRSLEQLSDKVMKVGRLFSSFMGKMKWVLPLFPLSLSFFFIKKVKPQSNTEAGDSSSSLPTNASKSSRLGKVASIAWKLFCPGGIGWKVFKMIRSARSAS